MTTIALPTSLKDDLREFGEKGEKYSDIIDRLLKQAKRRQLEEFLMDDKDCVPIEEALNKARKKFST